MSKSVVIRGAGGPEVLAIEERAVRAPGPGEVRVAVAAAGLNRADLLQRRGLYPAPTGAPPDVPGLEHAGTVEAVGEGVTSFRAGDRVMGIVAGGGMCEHVVAHERELVPVPEGMSLEDAAAVPEAFFTAWDALFAIGELAAGQSVLVHAVASGVGTAAIQIARATGATSIGTTRSERKLAACLALGLDHGLIVGEPPRFADAALALTHGRGVDVVLDFVGATYAEENAKAAAERGRVVILGLLGGAAAPIPLGLVLRRRLRIEGSVLRTRPLEEKAALAQDFARRALPLFARGALRPVIDAKLPMREVGEAHARMERNETLGKIVLVW